MSITVCWKWVTSDVDPDSLDTRWAGVSHADEAALEIALELAPTYGAVTVVCVGPVAADAALREALAAGATGVVRIDAPSDVDSRTVAIAMSTVASGSDFVICGDYSLDRGSGSVPAFLAHELGVAQALGLVDVDTVPVERTLRVRRRLDGGRREVLDVDAPAVVSVEGSVRRLRRASLAATVRAKAARVNIVGASIPADLHPSPVLVAPYRPRARTLAPPSGTVLERVREILDVGAADTGASESVELQPVDAAARIIDQLHRWGYLGADQPDQSG